MTNIKFIFFIFFVFSSALAVDCPNIRIDRDPKPSCLSATKVTEQGRLGTCYAHASASAIDCHRIAKGGKKSFQTSPLYLAIKSKDSWQDEFYGRDKNVNGLERGEVCEFIGKATKGPVCGHKSIEQAIISKDRSDGQGDDPVYKFYKELYKIHTDFQKLTKWYDDFTYMSAGTYRAKRKQARNVCELSATSGFILNDSIKDILAILKSNSFNRFLYKFMDMACKDDRVTLPENSKPECVTDTSAEQPRFQKTVIDNLKKGRPTIIGYCGFVLVTRSWTKEKCGSHASTIVGSRKHEGKCQMLVRNSWGTSCNSYRWPCEEEPGGSVWVDSSELKDSVFETTYLK